MMICEMDHMADVQKNELFYYFFCYQKLVYKFNPLSPVKWECNLKWVIFKFIWTIDSMCIFFIPLGCVPKDLNDDTKRCCYNMVSFSQIVIKDTSYLT